LIEKRDEDLFGNFGFGFSNKRNEDFFASKDDLKES